MRTKITTLVYPAIRRELKGGMWLALSNVSIGIREKINIERAIQTPIGLGMKPVWDGVRDSLKDRFPEFVQRFSTPRRSW